MAGESYTGIVLAGGQSTRMGIDKGRIMWKGLTLAEHAVNTLKPLCRDILISSNDPGYRSLGYPVIPDQYPQSGPMAGIHASLLESRTAGNLVIPVDTPLVTGALYRHLLKAGKIADVIVPIDHENFYQPLCAIYNKSILPAMEAQIRKRLLGFTPLFERVNCFPVPLDFTLPFYSPKTFFNMNTAADLESLPQDP
jgi:molybdopterin-guanine dinucleotide biosynthesis protein A